MQGAKRAGAILDPDSTTGVDGHNICLYTVVIGLLLKHIYLRASRRTSCMSAAADVGGSTCCGWSAKALDIARTSLRIFNYPQTDTAVIYSLGECTFSCGVH